MRPALRLSDAALCKPQLVAIFEPCIAIQSPSKKGAKKESKNDPNGLKPSFEKGYEKCCLDTLFTTFRPHRAIQKSLVFTRFRVYNLNKKGKSWKAPFNTHSWRLRWSTWGSKCDLCVPIGVPVGVVNSTQISKWAHRLHTIAQTCQPLWRLCVLHSKYQLFAFVLQFLLVTSPIASAISMQHYSRRALLSVVSCKAEPLFWSVWYTQKNWNIGI